MMDNEEFEDIVESLGSQYCKVWECRKMGLIEFDGFCEEHKKKGEGR